MADPDVGAHKNRRIDRALRRQKRKLDALFDDDNFSPLTSPDRPEQEKRRRRPEGSFLTLGRPPEHPGTS